MKRMVKTLATFAVMFFAVSTVAHAQGRGGGRGGPNYVNILKDSLHVSEAVAAKADSIAKAYQEKTMELRNSGGDMQTLMPKMQELRTQQQNDLKALLTPEQKAQFEKIVANMPQGRRGGGGGL